jgi:hypothetical protein
MSVAPAMRFVALEALMSTYLSSATRKKTGETCEIAGDYEFDGYVDGTNSPAPTAEERIIPMDKWDTFPPVKSSEKAAWWKLIRRK